jgi:hypothetical protein
LFTTKWVSGCLGFQGGGWSVHSSAEGSLDLSLQSLFAMATWHVIAVTLSLVAAWPLHASASAVKGSAIETIPVSELDLDKRVVRSNKGSDDAASVVCNPVTSDTRVNVVIVLDTTLSMLANSLCQSLDEVKDGLKGFVHEGEGGSACTPLDFCCLEAQLGLSPRTSPQHHTL